ncbi:hypothetical protein [Paraburkholderia terrae]|uniref:hypothetical protein n=1 Tax=Paraburkholderia terrae TaxID=311230 RepID=UPI001EE2021C|nr:hypothetical protein [Paraburkholderia terrae]GJH00226.1 hypothetical protein CBA19C8_06735 [Paraburkholderia terrae]
MTTQNRPFLDLTRNAFVRQKGEFTLYGTWCNAADDQTEPCLVILPAFRRDGAKPCCIALSSAFKYNDARYLVRKSHHFLQEMGMEPGMTTTHALATLIYDHLQDLIEMPPEPTAAIVVGEADLTMGDGRRRKVEILEHGQLPN